MSEIEIIEIEAGTAAFRELSRIMANPDTYKVRLNVRPDGIAIKRNEGMWSATLSNAKPVTPLADWEIELLTPRAD